MASTVATGLPQFGEYIWTKDITIMHTVADMRASTGSRAA